MKNFLKFLVFNNLIVQLALTQSWVPATPYPGPSGSIPGVVNHYLPWVSCMATYNNDLYVGGNFTSIGGYVANGIAKWNGNNWSPVDTAEGAIDMVVFNNKLYFTSGKLYSWDGLNLVEQMYEDQGQMFNIIGTDLHIFNGELYVVGTNLKLYKISSNNTSSFINLPYPTISSTLVCLEDFNGKLYLGTNNGVFVNENNTWLNISGVSSDPLKVVDLEAYGNNLYILGFFDAIGGLSTNNIAKYNGTNWSPVPLPNGAEPYTNPLGYWNFGTNHFNVINNELYLAHTLITPTGQLFSPVIKFNGAQWIDFTLNHTSGGGCVHLHNSTLFCGGHFNVFGDINGNSTQIDNLAKLDVMVSLGSLNLISNISTHPNPCEDNLNLKFPSEFINENFSLVDVFGKTIIEGKILNENMSVQIGEFERGVYYISVNGLFSSKIIKP